MDLDAFFASVEQMDHPAWKGKPVIVGGDAARRGVVSTCSYEARKYGVHSAMPASTAARLCPDAIWCAGRFDRYTQVSRQVMNILGDESPFLQQVSVDEAFLDISPTPHSNEDPIAIARRIQERVDALGVTCSIGLGTCKSVAKIASEVDKPHGMTVIYPGREAAFFQNLPVKKMSGIGPSAQATLKSFGIHTLGDVVSADESVLVRIFGKNAQMMRDRCAGADTDAVEADDEVKSVSNEISFAKDLHERRDIEAAVSTVASKVARRLRNNDLKANTITLRVRYEDRSARSVQRPLPYPCNDESVFIPILNPMLDELWSQGMALRLVGVAATKFGEADQPIQESLFDLDAFDVTDEMEDDVDSGCEGASVLGKNAPANGKSPGKAARSGSGTSNKSSGKAARSGSVRSKNSSGKAAAKTAAALSKATDSVRDRFGEEAVLYGREIRTKQNLTGSSAKNPGDYMKDRKIPSSHSDEDYAGFDPAASSTDTSDN